MIDQSIYRAIKSLSTLKKQHIIYKIIITSLLAGVTLGFALDLEKSAQYANSESEYLKTFLPQPELTKKAEECAKGRITAYSICEEQTIAQYKANYKAEYEQLKSITKLKNSNKQVYNLLWLGYYITLFIAISRVFRFELLYWLDDEFRDSLAACIITLANNINEAVEVCFEIDNVSHKQLAELEEILSSFDTNYHVISDSIMQYKAAFYSLQSQKLNVLYKLDK
jgi:hypothetical protein